MEATNNTNNSSALGMIIESKPASSDLSDKYGRRKIKTSWGTVGLAVVSANRIASKNQGPPNTNFQQMLGYVTRLFGGSSFPLQTEEFRRQMAAIKIQRAWRRQREKHHNGSMTEGHDVGYYSTEFFGHDRRTSDHSFRGGGGRMNDTNNRGTIATRSRPATALSRAFDPSSGSTSFGADAPTNKRRNESQVGSAMRELTGQRVALGIILAFLLTVFFTYVEENATRPAAMIVLHNQTANAAFADRAISAARQTAIPDLFQYTLANEETRQFNVVEGGVRPSELRSSERLRISISGYDGQATIGLFSIRDEQQEKALVGLVATIFILLVWFFGVTAFAGPVMVLVVIPIERMVRLLDMLMVDPLGYQGTPNYKRFTDEENEITKNTRWTNEILKGMETSFLMSTISRIGSLMKVGFGSAGVEIIRNNLEKGKSKNMLILNNQGSTVSCIFLFCDIRSFTDATECLQEEVFVFTNRIAAVVHSYVASYGGSANKNVGDAFLLSWLLEEEHTNRDRLFDGHDSFSSNNRSSVGFTARNHQADKALLSVVKICIALHYDEYYIEAMTEQARSALLAKLKNRKGPVVQMGFGLHAGRAVQGAIGSQRKIDATYVSEALELAEFLESSTKKYGVKMLMSRSFHDLLHPSNRRRCRKVDQIWIREDEDDADEEPPNGENTLDLFTFDINVDALWDEKKRAMKSPRSDAGRDSDSVSDTGSKRGGLGLIPIPRARRASMRNLLGSGRDATTTSAEDAISERAFLAGNSTSTRDLNAFEVEGGMPAKLVLPTGLALYNPNVWTSEEMRIMRQLYSDGLFFQKFSSGLQSFYVSRDWDHARQCFSTILERFEDGPSRYFLSQIEKYGSKPPRDFVGYGTA
jgi:class 3 adenylate cyclase